MKISRKIILGIFLILQTAVGLWAEDDLQNLLTGYLSNNLELKKLSSQMQKTLMENQISNLSREFSFNISTGTITFATGDDWSIRFSPSANFVIPQTKNLGISVSSSLLFDNKDETGTFSNSSIKLSMDIISNQPKNLEINNLKSQRKILEAQRNLQNGFVSAEKKFYETLKSLYEMSSKIISLEKNLYDHQLTLETLKSQGYTSSSTKYKTAQMNVLNDQHEFDSQKKVMEREVKIFCVQCNVDYDFENPSDFLPREIPCVDPISVEDYDSKDYTKIESAKWNQYINNLERQMDEKISLKANAGFTFGNEKTKSHTVDLGSDFTWNDTGLKISAGANLPVGADSFTPVFTLGLSVDPNAIKTAKINNQISDLDIEMEGIEIRNAETAYQTSSVTQKSTLENILWEKKSCQESFDMYSGLESDMAKYYRQGYISLTEYKNSQVNKENFRIKMLVNNLNMIIYNDETRLLFVRDQEFQEKNFPEISPKK